MEPVKFCGGCNTNKPETEFYQSRGRPAGKCKACVSQRNKDKYKADPDKVKQRVKAWVSDHRDWDRARGKRFRQTHKDDLNSKARGKKAQRRRELKAWVDTFKNAPCTDCHHNFPPVCMDFDHVPGRGEKIMDISTMVYKCLSQDLILEEMKKCDLVCANCHRIRTADRSNDNGL